MNITHAKAAIIGAKTTIVLSILENLLNAKFITGNINNQDLLINILNDFSIDAVIHFAAFTDVRESNLNPLKYYENNLIGSIKLIEAIIKNKTNLNRDLIYATYTVCIYNLK